VGNPDDRKYTKEHEWCKLEGELATVGITDYAQHALTDVVFVELPEKGKQVEQNKQLCILESVKHVSDVFAPVSGEVVEVNTGLESKPELLNKEPFGQGWIAKIRPSDKAQLGGLMSAAQYDAFIEGKEKK